MPCKCIVVLHLHCSECVRDVWSTICNAIGQSQLCAPWECLDCFEVYDITGTSYNIFLPLLVKNEYGLRGKIKRP